MVLINNSLKKFQWKYFMIVCVIILIEIFLLFSMGVTSYYFCEDIDYSDKVYWEEMASRGLFPIIDVKTNQPIIKPVGCEE